jgi:hypothetical protein
MTKRIYRTAQGKTVDMGALILQNENIRAVGNMNVNARGDQLDSSNQSIDNKNRQVQRQYKQAMGGTAPASGLASAPKVTEHSAPASTTPLSQENESEAESGLAAAMARSRAKKTTNE